MHVEADGNGSPEDLEAAVDDAVAACGGDLRAAVRALVAALGVYEAEIAALRDEAYGLQAAISPGYLRGRLSGQTAFVDEG